MAKSPEKKSIAGFEEKPQSAFVHDLTLNVADKAVTTRVRLTLGPGGRVVIPAAFRDAMEVKEGDAILAWVEDGELHLLSPRVGAKQAQAMIADLLPKGTRLADELLADRRREALEG